MKKVSSMILVAVFAALGLTAQRTMAKEKGAKAASGKEARWSGIISRSDKEASTLTVRKSGGTLEKVIYYDSSTKWTTQEKKQVKAIDPSEFKDGDRVICLGKYDEKGKFTATRIDKRIPR